jgi:hypothetical protein
MCQTELKLWKESNKGVRRTQRHMETVLASVVPTHSTDAFLSVWIANFCYLLTEKVTLLLTVVQCNLTSLASQMIFIDCILL